jgi:hypothetical protein
LTVVCIIKANIFSALNISFLQVWRLFQLFSDNFAVVLDFLILQDKHNIHTLLLNIKLICTRCETEQKSLTKARFSTWQIIILYYSSTVWNNCVILLLFCHWPYTWIIEWIVILYDCLLIFSFFLIDLKN